MLGLRSASATRPPIWTFPRCRTFGVLPPICALVGRNRFHIPGRASSPNASRTCYTFSLSRRWAQQTPRPTRSFEADQEEGGNPDQKLSHGRLAPPFDAAEPGGSPRPSPTADVAGSDGVGHGEGQTSLSACQSMGAERTKAGTRGASSRKDERPGAGSCSKDYRRKPHARSNT